MKRDFQVCTDCRTKVLARPLDTRPPTPTSQNWSASTLSTTLTAPTSQMSSASNNQQSTGNQKGSNYFFGILFSVAILILMCATCGIGSRARYFVRRRNVQREMEAREWKEESNNTPLLHEASFVNTGDVRWRDVMPLSVSYLCDNLDKPTKLTEGESSEDLNHRTPPRPSTTRSTRSQNRKNVSASDLEQPIAIRTLILIAMPSFHRDRRLGVDADDQSIKQSEIHIGVETLPWNKS